MDISLAQVSLAKKKKKIEENSCHEHENTVIRWYEQSHWQKKKKKEREKKCHVTNMKIRREENVRLYPPWGWLGYKPDGLAAFADERFVETLACALVHHRWIRKQAMAH